MEFFVFIWLVSLTVLLPLAVVKITTDYKRQRLEMEHAKMEAREGMTLGELKTIIRGAVEEANAPLAERVERLEHRLLPPEDTVLLDEPERTVGRQRVT
jgi:hypothetical protein